MFRQDADDTRQIVIGLLVLALLGLMILGLPGVVQSLVNGICRICHELERCLLWRFCPDLFDTVNYIGRDLIPTAILWP
jgi:hypothetical protein